MRSSHIDIGSGFFTPFHLPESLRAPEERRSLSMYIYGIGYPA
jgi:hypothetical protein